MPNEGDPHKRTKTIGKLWIGIAVLVLLSPLGLIIPALFGAGGAWGEWGLEELRKMSGFVPAGMEKLGRLWNSPMKDYAVPGQTPGIAGRGLGYLASAVIGAALTAALAFFAVRLLGRRKKGN